MVVKREMGFFKTLRDFELRHYLTRRVLAFFYQIYFWIIVIGTPIGIFAVFYAYNTRFGEWSLEPITILFFPLGVLVSFFLLLAIRLASESAVALVAIAENTEQGRKSNE